MLFSVTDIIMEQNDMFAALLIANYEICKFLKMEAHPFMASVIEGVLLGFMVFMFGDVLLGLTDTWIKIDTTFFESPTIFEMVDLILFVAIVVPLSALALIILIPLLIVAGTTIISFLCMNIDNPLPLLFNTLATRKLIDIYRFTVYPLAASVGISPKYLHICEFLIVWCYTSSRQSNHQMENRSTAAPPHDDNQSSAWRLWNIFSRTNQRTEYPGENNLSTQALPQ